MICTEHGTIAFFFDEAVKIPGILSQLAGWISHNPATRGQPRLQTEVKESQIL